MPRGELPLDELERLRQARLGDRGQLLAHRERIERAREVREPDPQDVAVLDLGEGAPRRLGIAGVDEGEPRGEVRGHLRAGARRGGLAELDEQIDQLGRVDEQAREVGARAEQRAEQPQDRRVLVEQPPHRPRLAAPGHQIPEEPQRLVRVRRRRDLGEQPGPDPRGPLRRARRQRRARAAPDAGELGARRGDVDEAEVAQGLGLVVVGEVPVDDRADLGALVRRIAERGEQPGHRAGVEGQLGRERRRRGVPEPARAPGERVGRGGQGLGLQPGLELEHVLGVAQPPVRAAEGAVLVVGDQAGEQQRVEGRPRAAPLQLWALAGVDQLQRLHEELDLADPALAVLEVEPLGGARRARPPRPHQLALDPAVEVPHLVDHRRGHQPREHERPQHREHLGPERGVPGARARLDPRLALPRATERLVVALHLRHRVGDRAARTLGAQPQIDAEHAIVLGHIGQRAGDLGGELGEVLVERELAGLALIGRVDVDHVDVRREVELVAAELAHADHRQPHLVDGAVVLDAGRHAVPRAQGGVVERDRRVEAGVRQPRELAADLHVAVLRDLADAEADQLVGADAA